MDPVAPPEKQAKHSSPGSKGRPSLLGDEIQIVRAVADLPPLPSSPTAREVLQHGLAASVGELLSALAAFESASGQAAPNGAALVMVPDDSLRRARLAGQHLDGQLRTFRPLLASSWSADLLDDLDRLHVEVDRARSSQVVRDRLHRWEAEGDDGVLRLDSPSPGTAKVLAAAEQRLSLDRIALLDLLGRPNTARLLDRLVEAASDPRTAPQADDPANEQLLAPVARSWRRMAKRARRLPSQKKLAVVGSADRRWDDVATCRDASLHVWTALEVLVAMEQPGPDRLAIRPATKKANRLYRLTAEMSELGALQVWLKDVAVRAHGQTAFAAGRLADVLWRESKPSKKRWNKARQADAFDTPAWLP